MTLDELLSHSTPEPNTGCYLWTGPARGKYGSVHIGRVQYYPHRLVLELATGEKPLGRWALHICDQQACINPKHLYWGSPRDNARDTVNRRRWVGHGALRNVNVAIIRTRFSAGETGRALAREYGVSPAAISRVVTGKTWRA